jgi:hypothetical protein
MSNFILQSRDFNNKCSDIRKVCQADHTTKLCALSLNSVEASSADILQCDVLHCERNLTTVELFVSNKHLSVWDAAMIRDR